MSQDKQEELSESAKEKAEVVKKAAEAALNKAKNMSADEAKELAKEKAEQAKKAATEATEKLKNMSSEDAKKLASEKIESIKSLDSSVIAKLGGVALLALLLIVFIFNRTSYSDEFIKSRIKVPSGSELISFDIVSEDELEFMGHKGIEMVLNVTYKSTSDKFKCSFDRNEKSYTFSSKTEEGCFKAQNKKDWSGFHKSSNHQVVSAPKAEFSEVKTITFDKTQLAKWEAKHS